MIGGETDLAHSTQPPAVTPGTVSFSDLDLKGHLFDVLIGDAFKIAPKPPLEEKWRWLQVVPKEIPAGMRSESRKGLF
jgi:hypothetical protein